MAKMPEQLQRLADEIKNGQDSSKFTPRELLDWFGAQRRGREIVWMIQRTLKDMRLKTEPDFEYAYIDGEIRLVPMYKKTKFSPLKLPLNKHCLSLLEPPLKTPPIE